MASGWSGIVLSRGRWEDDVGAGRSFDTGMPRALFHANAWSGTNNQVYAVTRDGQRFLVNTASQKSSGVAPLTGVLNWRAAINR
jgi:hypothetical protein